MIVQTTTHNPNGKRMGEYTRGVFTLPTVTNPFQMGPGLVASSPGLGALDLSTLTRCPLLMVGIGLAAWWFLSKKR
jgi:hypothetical protein